MTRAHRRDKGTTSGSVITGLRLESELAKDLRTEAVERAGGDIAELARFLIRTGLGYSARDANELEAKAPKPARLCGLALERDVMLRLKGYAGSGLSVAGAARHLLRLGLGYKAAESLAIEGRFAAIATARRELADAYKEM